MFLLAIEKIMDVKTFESLCAIQCTKDEICAVLGIDEKTLTKQCKKQYSKPFSEVFTQKRKTGKASLRRSQWTLASGGNATMLIWLGKQYLQQSDKLEQKNDNNNQNKIVIEFEDQKL